MIEDDRNEVLRIEYHDKLSGDDDEYIPCTYCKIPFCPDYAEMSKGTNGNRYYKCPRCEKYN